MKILITGGAGFIGSVLCRKMLNKGFEVKILDNLTLGDVGIKELYENGNFELIEGDIRSRENVIEGVKDVDGVISLAALVGDGASAINPQKTIETNYHSTLMIAKICKHHQLNRFIFASTCSVYGKSSSPSIPLTEESELNPVSLYAETKIQSERALLDMREENFSPIIFRMATVYGLSPRMRFDLVVNTLSAKAYFEKNIPIFGGRQYRPNVHVSDVAEAYIKCLEAPIEKVGGEIFNVGSNEQNYKIVELGEKINECFPDATLEIHKSIEDGRDYYVDFSKIKDILDYKVDWTIKKGVEEIKKEMKNGKFRDYTAHKYSNYGMEVFVNGSK